MTPRIPSAWRVDRALVLDGRPGALVVVAGSGRELHVACHGGVLAVTALPWGWRSDHREAVADLLGMRLAEETVALLRRGQAPEAGDERP